MKYLPLRIRNLIDFISFGIKTGNIGLFAFVIDVIILIYTLSDIRTILSAKSLVVLFSIIFFNVIWQAYSTVKDCRNYYRRVDCFNTSVGVSQDFKFDSQLAGCYDVLKLKEINSAVMISDKANRVLRSSEIKCRRTSRKEKQVRKYIKTYKDTLLKFLNWKWHAMTDKGGAFFNESKLCMAGELFENALPDGTFQLSICRGSYYNSFLTNNIYCVCLNESGFILEAPRNVRNYGIRLLSESEFSDHIGVSTIIVSSDGYVFLMRHNNKTVVSNNQLLPSASGSADFSDLRDDPDFKSVIIRAVERELREETGLKGSVIDHTEITGFYRCLERGGKPEFCCITFLNINKIDVQELLKPEKAEMSDEFHQIKVPVTGDTRDFSSLTEFITARQTEASLPLCMTYYMMLDYYGENPEIGQIHPIQTKN